MKPAPPLRHAMSIDVEEHYHAHAMAPFFPRALWDALPSRIAPAIARMLRMFDGAGAKATFFCLGIVARANPALVREVAARGHEIASHGWDHRPVWSQKRSAFRADVRRTRALLEDICGSEVTGYRAPGFSIDARTPWARVVLAEEGYRYSSSVNPAYHTHHGNPSAPRTPFLDPAAPLLEIPVTALCLFGLPLPCGGGGFFRLLPNVWFRTGLRQTERRGIPGNFFLHPWEFDPEQPRAKGAGFRTRFRHYFGLTRCAGKFLRHLDARPWGRMDDIYAPWLDAH